MEGEKKKEKTSVAETPPLDNQGCALGQDGLDSFLMTLNQLEETLERANPVPRVQPNAAPLAPPPCYP